MCHFDQALDSSEQSRQLVTGASLRDAPPEGDARLTSAAGSLGAGSQLPKPLGLTRPETMEGFPACLGQGRLLGVLPPQSDVLAMLRLRPGATGFEDMIRMRVF